MLGSQSTLLRNLGEVYGAVFWTEVEACVGIFCASAPALKQLAQNWVPTILNFTAFIKQGDDAEGNEQQEEGSFYELKAMSKQ
jgi:hypothetical protein